MRLFVRLEGKVPHPMENKGPKFKLIGQFCGGMAAAGDERKHGKSGRGRDEQGTVGKESFPFSDAHPVSCQQHWHM